MTDREITVTATKDPLGTPAVDVVYRKPGSKFKRRLSLFEAFELLQGLMETFRDLSLESPERVRIGEILTPRVGMDHIFFGFTAESRSEESDHLNELISVRSRYQPDFEPIPFFYKNGLLVMDLRLERKDEEEASAHE